MAPERHTHPGVILALAVSLTAVAIVLGIFASSVGEAAKSAKDASTEAKETANIARDVTDPNCDTSRPACRRSRAQQGGQGTVVADINDVSVIGAYCAQQHTELAAVRTCVGEEFRRLTGRPPALATTTTTKPGG